MPVARHLLTGLSLAFAVGIAAAGEPKKITYEDDVLPIFRDNCLKCHNPDKLKGDLDLTSFSSAIKGGGSGTTLTPGDPDGSQLFKSITHADEPTMPPNAKLPDKDIVTIRAWIEGGLLQGVNSRAMASGKPKVDFSLKSPAIGKPDGPPPMPAGLSLEPLVRPVRGTALGAIASSPWAPLVALGGARQVVLYNTSDLELVGVLPFPEGTACDVKFSRNGKLLLAGGGHGGKSGGVVMWDITTGARIITVGDQFDSVLAADVSADQQWIALGGPDRVLKIYHTRDGVLEHRIKKHTEWVTAVEFSPDGKYLASGDRNGGLVLWEAETGHEMFTLPGHKGAITAITWRSDSQIFVSASEDGTLKLWKANDGTAVRSVAAHAGGVLSARFAQDGRIVSCGRDNKIQIWDATGKNLRALPFKGELPNRACFSHDGQRVIASDWKGEVLVWDAKTGKAQGALDATPPTLAERVKESFDRIGALQAEVAQAKAAHTKAEAESKAAQARVIKVAKSLADGQKRLAAKEAEMKTADASFAGSGASGDVPRAPNAAMHAAVEALKAQVAAWQKEATEAATQARLLARKAADAKGAADASTASLAAARASLAKWKAVQQRSQTASLEGRAPGRG